MDLFNKPCITCKDTNCRIHDTKTGKEFCPRCIGDFRSILSYEEVQVLQNPKGLNALSRRDNKTYICRICGLTEAYADMGLGMDDAIARRAVQNDLNEIARLPGMISYLGIQYKPGIDRIEGTV